ncbi:MAG: enoyl-CoA hydratase/isomerase family protein [Actinobacteria bacterium]|nr:enoyl-CoA hydratase/isomerase family protein [Actinomycetota bacterium]
MADGIRLEPGEVSVITIDRPAASNSLNRASLDALAAAIMTVREGSARAVVLTGAGEKAFCAGADLKERAGMSDDEVRDFIRTIRDTATAIANLPQPVIAAINGVAFGGGCELALACDIRVMADTATIGLTETGLGIIPGGGGTQRLPRLVGRGRALEMILTALQIGLVEEIAGSGETLKRADEIAQRIAANAPIAVKAAKEAVRRGLEMPLDNGLKLETELYERTLGTKDRRERLAAFREKCRPMYRGE